MSSTRISSLQLHKVSYKYPHSDKVALSEVSYTFSRGMTAIVGPNGAGKSTLVKLLTGLLEPASGTISARQLDGTRLSPDQLDKAVLFQEPSHLYLTVRQNITMRFEQTPGEDERIYAALAKAGLGKVVKGLPEGLDTLVGAGFGGQTDLSGGQWQRLALARLIYQNAPMIILDEPVASLDPEGERSIFQLFTELAGSRIIIFTTHRYDSIPKNTKIVVLVDGVISESGTHEELLQQQGHYRSLYMSEALAKETVAAVAGRPEGGAHQMNGHSSTGVEEGTFIPRSTSLKTSSTPNLVPRLLTSVGKEQEKQAAKSESTKDRALVKSGLNFPSVLAPSPNISGTISTGQAPPRRTKKRMVFLFILLLLLAALIPGTLLIFAHHGTRTAAAVSPIVGHAFFISSGQITERSNQGINDELLIELQNVPDPAPGNAYYAWLLGDETRPLTPPVLLGRMPVNHGQVHFLYAGDSSHTNLMAMTSRILITEENASMPHSNPSPDKSTWRYYAQLPQTPDSMDMMHEGALQHLRHLLVDAPELTAINLPGGLDIWLFRNAQKVFEWSGGARDFWANRNPGGIRNMVIRVLDYLDGASNVMQDVPMGTPNLVNPLIAPVALLPMGQQNQMDQQQMSAGSGLLYMIGVHLAALVQAPGISQKSHLLAARIHQDSDNVQAHLQNVRTYARQLITMNNAQLLSTNALSLLDSMETEARYAFIGQIDPNTDTVQGGVVEIHYTIERLATYDIAHV